MISNKILPAHLLRLYIWEVLQLNTSMTTINGYVPILPIEDEPRVADSGKPYLIYGYAENQASGPDQIRNGTLALRVNAMKFSELGQILNVISATFEDRSIAAESVNMWTSEYESNGTNPLVGIRFASVQANYIEGGEPADDEAGEIYGSIMIDYRYISELQVTLPAVSGTRLWQ